MGELLGLEIRCTTNYITVEFLDLTSCRKQLLACLHSPSSLSLSHSPHSPSLSSLLFSSLLFSLCSVIELDPKSNCRSEVRDSCSIIWKTTSPCLSNFHLEMKSQASPNRTDCGSKILLTGEDQKGLCDICIYKT